MYSMWSILRSPILQAEPVLERLALPALCFGTAGGAKAFNSVLRNDNRTFTSVKASKSVFPVRFCCA